MAGVARPQDINEAFQAAFNRGDLAGLLALYETDAVLCLDLAGRQVSGAEAIARELQAFLDTRARLDSRQIYCVEQDGVALIRARWVLRDAQGAPVASGHTAEVVRRQADGTWLYLVDHAAGAEPLD